MTELRLPVKYQTGTPSMEMRWGFFEAVIRTHPIVTGWTPDITEWLEGCEGRYRIEVRLDRTRDDKGKWQMDFGSGHVAISFDDECDAISFALTHF